MAGFARVTGIVLAAGAGTRAGGPKALRRATGGEPWAARAARLAREAGCARVLVVLGAAAERARELVPAEAEVVVAQDWAEGISASLRAGLAAAADDPATVAALIMLVDLPDLPSAAVRRVLDAPGVDPGAGIDAGTLRRAVYGGRPGHPVLLGRAHWEAVAATARGDRGAGPYLATAGAAQVECGDLGDGLDVDR